MTRKLECLEQPQEFAIACENCNQQIGWIFATPSVWMALKTISCKKCRPLPFPSETSRGNC